MAKPTIPEVLPLVHDLYRSAHGAVGGCLHIVLDDSNIHDEHVQYCLDRAIERGCTQCETIARLLLQMSRTQRNKISSLAYPKDYWPTHAARGYKSE